MKKIVTTVVLLACLFFWIPAIASGDVIVYGIVTKIVSPFGPVLVETYDGISIRAQLPKNADPLAFYLGCEISCQADVDGKMYITDLPTPIEELNVTSWVAQVRRISANTNKVLLSSPAGDVMVFFSNRMLATTNLSVGSVIKLFCAKPVWGIHYIAISFQLMSH